MPFLSDLALDNVLSPEQINSDIHVLDCVCLNASNDLLSIGSVVFERKVVEVHYEIDQTGGAASFDLGFSSCQSTAKLF